MAMWRGKRLNEMSREELYKAFNDLGGIHKRDAEQHSVDLEMLHNNRFIGTRFTTLDAVKDRMKRFNKMANEPSVFKYDINS